MKQEEKLTKFFSPMGENKKISVNMIFKGRVRQI